MVLVLLIPMGITAMQVINVTLVGVEESGFQ